MITSLAEQNEKGRKKTIPLKRLLEKLIDHNFVVILMTIVTAYTLFFDDIRVFLLPKSVDEVCFTVTFISMMLFAIEITIATYAKDDYVFSFFFWLDIISTVTMIPDIPWIWEPMIGETDSGSSKASDLA